MIINLGNNSFPADSIVSASARDSACISFWAIKEFDFVMLGHDATYYIWPDNLQIVLIDPVDRFGDSYLVPTWDIRTAKQSIEAIIDDDLKRNNYKNAHIHIVRQISNKYRVGFVTHEKKLHPRTTFFAPDDTDSKMGRHQIQQFGDDLDSFLNSIPKL